MPRVTAIRPKGRAQDRFVVTFDDALQLLVDIDLRLRFGLREDELIDEAARASLQDSSGLLEATDRALRILACRGRSRSDLCRRLVEKGIQRRHAEQVVEKLAGQGLVDDAAFARHFARSKARTVGRRRLAFELARQGVAPEVASAAIREAMEDPTVEADGAIDRLIAKKAASLSRLDPLTRRRRLLGFLGRRGFGMGEIQAALERSQL